MHERTHPARLAGRGAARDTMEEVEAVDPPMNPTEALLAALEAEGDADEAEAVAADAPEAARR